MTDRPTLTAEQQAAIAGGTPHALPMPPYFADIDEGSLLADMITARYSANDLALKVPTDPLQVGYLAMNAGQARAIIDQQELRLDSARRPAGSDWIVAVAIDMIGTSVRTVQPGEIEDHRMHVAVGTSLPAETAAWLGARMAATPEAFIDERAAQMGINHALGGTYGITDLSVEVFHKCELADKNVTSNFRVAAAVDALHVEISLSRDDFSAISINPKIEDACHAVAADTYADPLLRDGMNKWTHGTTNPDAYQETLDLAKAGGLNPVRGMAVVIDVAGAYNHVTDGFHTRHVLAAGINAEEARTLAEVARMDPASFISAGEHRTAMRTLSDRHISVSTIDLDKARAAGETPLAGALYGSIDRQRIAILSEVLTQGWEASRDARAREDERMYDFARQTHGPRPSALPQFLAAEHLQRSAER